MSVHLKAEQIAFHVCYEYWMFSEAVKQYSPALRRNQRFQHNLLLESILLHARVIYEFLFSKPKYADDVRSKDFFVSPNQWKPDKSKLRLLCNPKTLERIHRSLPHLSYDRLNYDKNPGWSIGSVAKDIQEAWDYFLRELPDERRQWFHSALQRQQLGGVPRTK